MQKIDFYKTVMNAINNFRCLYGNDPDITIIINYPMLGMTGMHVNYNNYERYTAFGYKLQIVDDKSKEPRIWVAKEAPIYLQSEDGDTDVFSNACRCI